MDTLVYRHGTYEGWTHWSTEQMTVKDDTLVYKNTVLRLGTLVAGVEKLKASAKAA